MNYEKALSALRDSKSIRRSIWPLNEFISDDSALGMTRYSDHMEPIHYYPSNADSNAQDWEVFIERKEPKPIQPTDTVSLLSGGPIMTVVSITPRSLIGMYADSPAPGDLALCRWFDKLDQLHQDSFFTSLLTRVNGLK